jgi:Na+/melibiose symporter-like transporter
MRRVGAGTKIAHGVGSMAFAAKDAAFVNFVAFFYTQVAGLSGTLYGIAAFIGQLSDAITDPIFGTISDNARSRWGRWHPFMVASIVPLALCFLLLFNPPDGWSGIALCLWLACTAVALRTFLTMFTIPHTAFGAELSEDYEERSLIVSYRTLLGWIAVVALPAVGLTLFFSQGSEGTDGRLIAGNYIDYGWMSACIVVFAITVTTAFTRKEIPHLPAPGPRRKLRLLDPARDVASALQNLNFRRVFIALLFVGASSGVAVTLGYYANTYFWEFSSAQIAAIVSSSVLGVTLAFGLLRPIVQHFEKKHIFLTAVVVMIVNGTWWIGGRLIDVLPPNGSPVLFYLAIFNQVVLAAAVMIMQTIGASLVADIVDEHESETGERREGVFFAAMGFSMKIPTGLGQLVGGILIDVVGLGTGLEPGEVPGDVLWKLGLVAGPLISLSFLIPVLLLRSYDLDRAKHAQLRSSLEAAGTQPGAP